MRFYIVVAIIAAILLLPSIGLAATTTVPEAVGGGSIDVGKDYIDAIRGRVPATAEVKEEKEEVKEKPPCGCRCKGKK
ncbi:hypothetical protein ACFLRA_01100 [Bdellovibrionota bacterium]